MLNSQLIKALKAINLKEVRRFCRYVQSPYFCSDQRVWKFADLLKKYYPDYSAKSFTKEKVFGLLYPEQDYKDELMRKMISRMKQLLENYLVELELERNPFIRKKLLVQAYGHRNMTPFFDRNILKLTQSLLDAPERGIDFHLEMFLINKEIYLNPNTETFTKELSSIEELMKHLDAFIILSKLCFSSEMLTREVYLDEHYDILFLEEIQRTIKQMPKVEQQSFYDVFLNLIEIQSEGGDLDLLEKTEELFNAKIGLMSKVEKSLINKNLINHAISKYNTGYNSYGMIIFRFYKIAVKNGLILHQNRISTAAYTNIVVMGSIKQEFEWTMEFIIEYEQYLEEEERGNAKSLCLAYWYYHQDDFKTCIDHLNKVKFSTPSFGARARILSLKSFYELYLRDDRQYDMLLSQIDSFKKYMQRDEVLSKLKSKVYINFINFISKLINVNILEKKKVKKRLQEELEGAEPIVGRTWLEDKIKAL